jgi:nitrile hydratase
MVGLGPVPVETHARDAEWEQRTLGATVSAVITGMLVPPTHRAVIEALHPVAYLSMGYYEKWLYALEQCAVTGGVITQGEIEARVADMLSNPDAPMPRDRNPEILEGVRRLVAKGAPLGPEALAQPPRFTAGDIVRTRRIESHATGRRHTRIPGYAQECTGVVEMVHRPMPLEDILVASGQILFEYVYAVRLRTRDVWPDADGRDTVVVDLWESYLEDRALTAATLEQEHQ